MNKEFREIRTHYGEIDTEIQFKTEVSNKRYDNAMTYAWRWLNSRLHRLYWQKYETIGKSAKIIFKKDHIEISITYTLNDMGYIWDEEEEIRINI